MTDDRFGRVLARVETDDELVREWFHSLAGGDSASGSLPCRRQRCRAWVVDFTGLSVADFDRLDAPARRPMTVDFSGMTLADWCSLDDLLAAAAEMN